MGGLVHYEGWAGYGPRYLHRTDDPPGRQLPLGIANLTEELYDLGAEGYGGLSARLDEGGLLSLGHPLKEGGDESCV